MLAGGTAKCKACAWQGPKDKLLSVPLPHDLGSNDELLQRMLGDWRAIFGRAAGDFGRFLIKWGMVDVAEQFGEGEVRLNPKQFSRYIATTALAGFRALLLERMKIEKEKASGN